MTKNERPTEAHLLSRFRLAGAGGILVATIVYVAADIFQLPFLRDGFHTEPTVLGILLGSFLLLVGVETLNRLPGISSVRRDDEE